MSPRLQAKLLRFLQDSNFRRVGSDEEVYLDVQVICATQVDLSELCAKGEFRQDLYHRLNVLSLHIPPLRECLDGLAPLAEHFLDQASRQISCGLQAFRAGAGTSRTLPLAGQRAAIGKRAVPGRFRCAKRLGQGRAHPPAGLRRTAAAGGFPARRTSTPSSGAQGRRCWSACSRTSEQPPV